MGTRKLLYSGGELFINRTGSLYTVDVFDADAQATDEPVYHASYQSPADADADAASWKAWDDDSAPRDTFGTNCAPPAHWQHQEEQVTSVEVVI